MTKFKPKFKPKSISIYMNEEDQNLLAQKMEEWGFTDISAYIKMTILMQESRMKLEHLDAHEENAMAARQLGIMKGGRR